MPAFNTERRNFLDDPNAPWDVRPASIEFPAHLLAIVMNDLLLLGIRIDFLRTLRDDGSRE